MLVSPSIPAFQKRSSIPPCPAFSPRQIQILREHSQLPFRSAGVPLPAGWKVDTKLRADGSNDKVSHNVAEWPKLDAAFWLPCSMSDLPYLSSLAMENLQQSLHR